MVSCGIGINGIPLISRPPSPRRMSLSLESKSLLLSSFFIGRFFSMELLRNICT